VRTPGIRFVGGLLLLALLSTAGCDHPAIPRPGDEGRRSALRGRYLANAVSLCVFCHSQIDWSREGFPPKGERFAGGNPPFPEGRPPRASPNLTPEAGTWTDAAPVCASFRDMAEEDVESITLYLRSMPGGRHRTPRSSLQAPLRRRPAGSGESDPVESPDRSKTVEYGSYLLRIAACCHCHTPLDADGTPMAGMDLAGGSTLKGPWGEVVVPNITADPTGLDELSEREFDRAVRQGDLHGARLNAVMPWGYYGDMTEADVRSIYAALKSRRGVRHTVNAAELPTPCRKCGSPHGGGSRNG